MARQPLTPSQERYRFITIIFLIASAIIIAGFFAMRTIFEGED